MYSGQFSDVNRITRATIIRIYREEAIAMTKRRTYIGIWQIFALSSVLGVKLFSVYPLLGNPNIHQDLHRLIKPRNFRDEHAIAYIMWTSTRYRDMGSGHFAPNHFVPMLKLPKLAEELLSAIHSPADYEDVSSVKSEEEHADADVVTSCSGRMAGTHVVVRYGKQLYPGLVIDEDEADVRVKCMHKTGINRFFWPPRDDSCW